MKKVKRLPVHNIDAALRAYYGKGYLNNNDIGEIFGTTTKSTIYEMKRPVIAEERKREYPVVVPFHVCAKIAFEVWGIDVAELERNKKKLDALGL